MLWIIKPLDSKSVTKIHGNSIFRRIRISQKYEPSQTLFRSSGNSSLSVCSVGEIMQRASCSEVNTSLPMWRPYLPALVALNFNKFCPSQRTCGPSSSCGSVLNGTRFSACFTYKQWLVRTHPGWWTSWKHSFTHTSTLNRWLWAWFIKYSKEVSSRKQFWVFQPFLMNHRLSVSG